MFYEFWDLFPEPETTSSLEQRRVGYGQKSGFCIK